MLQIITPASTSDLTLLASVKSELKISGSSQDTDLAALISDVSGILAEACGLSTFGRETVKQTERLVREQHSIILDRDINPAITEVVVDGVTLAPADVELDAFQVFRLSSDRRVCWTRGSKVELTYAAGYVLLDSLPRSIERACRALVISSWRGRGRDPNVSRIQTEGVGSIAYFDAADWRAGQAFPPDIQAVVDANRRIPV